MASIEQKKKSPEKEKIEEVAIKAKAPRVAKAARPQIDLQTKIKVVNGYSGRLVYRNTKTGYSFAMSELGDYDHIELSELIAMKNMQPGFFANGWIIIEDLDVIETLGISKYIKNAIRPEDVEGLLNLPKDELRNKTKSISSSQKDSLLMRAYKLIEDGTIDSRKTIQNIEEVFGVELIER